MTADSCFTLADERNGYAKTRAALAGESTEQITKQYLGGMRDCFNDVFGGNARRFSNLLADELLRRGVTELGNIFGPIAVKRWTY